MNFHDVFIQIGRGTLHARIWQPEKKHDDTNEKAPIILFHDSLGCVNLWRKFPSKLSNATHRTVIAYDRLGFGKSADNHDRQGLDFVGLEAEIYLPVLQKQLCFDRFVAFGHSVGGGMTVYCAARFPDNCEALITESAQAFVEDRTLQGIREAKAEFDKDPGLERLKKYHGDKAQWVLDSWIDTWLSPEFSSWNLKQVLPQVKCPVLAIHGSEDEFGSVRHPQLICELASGKSTLKILPGVRHVPHREHEQEIVELVAGFLTGVTEPQPMR